MSEAAPKAPDAGTVRIPDWLLTGEPAMCPCGCIGKHKKGYFVEKTLNGGAALMRQVMFSEDVAAQPGLLQRLDPRAKIVGLVVLLVSASLLHNIATLVAMYLLTLVVAAVSRLPVGFFIKRVWLFIPVFTLIVVLPATLSIITPGKVLLQLWTWEGHPEGLTEQGLTSAGLVVMRVAVSISLVVLLTVTTPWIKLLSALRALGVSRIFVLIIGMCYRYIFLLLGSVTDMYESRKSRTVGAVQHDKAARTLVTTSAGALFGKAHYLSEEVHQAMVARGYRGDAKTLQGLRLQPIDVTFALGVVLCAAAALGGDRLLGR